MIGMKIKLLQNVRLNHICLVCYKYLLKTVYSVITEMTFAKLFLLVFFIKLGISDTVFDTSNILQWIKAVIYFLHKSLA